MDEEYPYLLAKLDSAIDTAIEATTLVRRWWGKLVLGTQKKLDGSEVTTFERIISSDIMSKLPDETSNYGLLDEEKVADEIMKAMADGSRTLDVPRVVGDYLSEFEYCWTSDPIDNTKGFINGDGYFGPLIGLLQRVNEEYQPILGVTSNDSPIEIVHAVRGRGAYIKHGGYTLFRDGTEVLFYNSDEFLTPEKLDGIHVVTSPFETGPDLGRVIDRLPSLRSRRQLGGMFKVVELAKGTANLALFPPSGKSGLWDVVPVSVILDEVGGTMTDFFGNPIDYATFTNDSGLVASINIDHGTIIDITSEIYGKRDEEE